MSDWGAHHSGVASSLAGMDMSMPGDIGFDSATSYWGTNLTIAVLNGSVPAWRLDDMATRIVAGWYYVGRDQNQVEDAPNFSSWTLDTYGYEHDYAMVGYGVVNRHVDVTEDHGANIRDSAAKGTVILKNNGVLPLTGKEKLTTVFGSDAGPNLYGPNGCVDRGRSHCIPGEERCISANNIHRLRQRHTRNGLGQWDSKLPVSSHTRRRYPG